VRTGGVVEAIAAVGVEKAEWNWDEDLDWSDLMRASPALAREATMLFPRSGFQEGRRAGPDR
jgi:hypothetical protein